MTQALAQNNPAVPLNPALQPLSCASAIANIGKVALFIIGCLGATGLIPASSLGWTSLGLASAVLALELSASDNNTNEKIFATIQTVAIVMLSILAGANLLNAPQLGWGIIGTTVIAASYKIFKLKIRLDIVTDQNIELTTNLNRIRDHLYQQANLFQEMSQTIAEIQNRSLDLPENT